MNYILNANEMKMYDRDTSERIGIPSMVLMERASLGVVESLKEQNLKPDRILVVAGMGNNGGDGLAGGGVLAGKRAEGTFYYCRNAGGYGLGGCIWRKWTFC